MKNLLWASLLACLTLFACSKDSEPEPEPDTTAPTVSFSIAGNSGTGSSGTIVVSTSLEINIAAQDAGGIARIEAFLDGVKVGEDTSAPFSIIVDVSSYTSKVASTGKYKDYTLRIVATDTAGNQSSQEQTINIDNELPVITEVSLEADTVLAGDMNEVTFEATDNEELTEVRVLVNGTVQETYTTPPFQFNLATAALEDGPNTLVIEAEDSAANLASYEVGFIADNTGPEIGLESITEGMVLDGLHPFTPTLSDAYSEIVSYQATVNGEIISETNDGTAPSLDIDSETLPAGAALFELTATDALGNSSAFTVEAEVLRRLFQVSMESGFLKTSWYGYWILLSEMDGTLIDLVSVSQGSSEVIIHAPGEFAPDKEYMVSFIAEEDRGGWIQTHMTVVQNLTRSNFHQMEFTPPNGEGISSGTLPMTGFLGVENIIGYGRGFQTTFDNEQTEFTLEQYSGANYEPYNDFYLMGYEFGDDPSYAYLLLDNPWDPAQTIDRADFTMQGVISGSVDFSNNNLPNPVSHLMLYGYRNAGDKESKLWHRIFDTNYTFGFAGSEEYSYPDIFDSYEFHLKINNYNTYREGLPPAQITIPDWTIDYAQTGREIALTKTGTGHTVGRLVADLGIPNNSQQIIVLFDSSVDGPVYLPELPAELSSLNVYDSFQNGTVSVDYAELISFDTLPSYRDYLDQVVGPYKEHTEVAPVMESITDKNAYIFTNWSFKYF